MRYKVGDEVRVQSCTSGSWLPGIVHRVSKLRGFFRLPCIEIAYIGTNLTGPVIVFSWFKSVGPFMFKVESTPLANSRH